MNINKAFIYGNLTRDPESKALPSGVQITTMGVATNRVYKNQQGEKAEEAEFHNVVLFGKLSELAQQYLKKGSGVFIEGRLRTSSWEADNVKKYKTEIVAESMQFGPRSGGGSTTEASPKENVPPAANYPENTISPDDIPF